MTAEMRARNVGCLHIDPLLSVDPQNYEVQMRKMTISEKLRTLKYAATALHGGLFVPEKHELEYTIVVLFADGVCRQNCNHLQQNVTRCENARPPFFPAAVLKALQCNAYDHLLLQNMSPSFHVYAVYAASRAWI